MIQFLQSSAKLSACYAYIGVALRSALRMGLHRSFNANFNSIEAETRKRIFWVIRRMDSYVGAMLGLPRFLEDEDIDQDWPAEVDDDYITEAGILSMPEGSVSVMVAFNAHTRIVQVLSKICKYVYPIKGPHTGDKDSVTYTVAYSKIRELEQDLAQWLDELPSSLRPGEEASPLILRSVQYAGVMNLANNLAVYNKCSAWLLDMPNSCSTVHSSTMCPRPNPRKQSTHGLSPALPPASASPATSSTLHPRCARRVFWLVLIGFPCTRHSLPWSRSSTSCWRTLQVLRALNSFEMPWKAKRCWHTFPSAAWQRKGAAVR
jgi:hypothetical protein